MDRRRFELTFNQTPRDKRLAAWIDWQQQEGRNPTEIIKNVLDEIVTGKSSLTGRIIQYQGDVASVVPEPGDPIIEKLLSIED